MTDTTQIPSPPSASELAERATPDASAASSSEDQLVALIRAGVRRAVFGLVREAVGRTNWIEGTIDILGPLKELREKHASDKDFSARLKASGIDYFSHQERAALLGLASDIGLARVVLSETDSRSYELIWARSKDRFTSARKPRHHGSHSKSSNGISSERPSPADKRTATLVENAERTDAFVETFLSGSGDEQRAVINHLGKAGLVALMSPRLKVEFDPPKKAIDDRALFMSLLDDLKTAIELARDPAADDDDPLVKRMRGLGERLAAAGLLTLDAGARAPIHSNNGISQSA